MYADEDDDSEEAEGLLAAAAQVLGLPPAGVAPAQGRAAAAAAGSGADLEVSSVSEEVLDIPEDIVVGGQVGGMMCGTVAARCGLDGLPGPCNMVTKALGITML